MEPMTPMLTFVWPDTALSIGVILLVAMVTHLLAGWAIRNIVRASLRMAEARYRGLPGAAEKILRDISGANSARHEARVQTMASVLRNAVDIALFALVLLTSLRIMGIPLEPLLASAGIGGVALAFGAQSLVRDYISGLFLILEDQYGVGDYIDTGPVQGTVEEVGLRVTRLRDDGGQVWYVRNGEIQRIGNTSQGWTMVAVDVPIHSAADAERATEVLTGVAAEVFADPQWAKVLLGMPVVEGADVVGDDDTAAVRVLAKCAPKQGWGIKYDILQRAEDALTKAGLRHPDAATEPS